MYLEDGSGHGYKAAVNSENQLVVQAVTEPEIVHSGQSGLAYSWFSGERDIDAGDTMLFVKNLADADLILDQLVINGSNVICLWEVNIGNLTTTPAGTSVTPVNLNRKYSARSADAIAYYDETAIADGDTVMQVRTPVTDTVFVDIRGIILGKNHYIQINQETESTAGSVALLAHYDPLVP
jgi:hypothetical protein